MTTPIIIIGIVIAIVMLIALIFVFQSNNTKSIQSIQKGSFSIISELSPEINTIGLSKRAWLKVLDQNNYLHPLCSEGSMIVIGSPEMGTSEILKWVAREINSDFPKTHRVSIYFNVDQVIGEDEHIFAENLYRSIILAMVNPFVDWVEKNFGIRKSIQSGIVSIKSVLDENLNNNFIDMPVAEICQNLISFFDIFSVSGVKLCLDKVTEHHSDLLPYLIHLLMRTFEKSGNFGFVISGNFDRLTLMADTPQGPIGGQFGHDIFLGLNLEELLIPYTDQYLDSIPSEGIRSEFITEILKQNINQQNFEPNNTIHQYFDPPNTWTFLFRIFKGDVDKIGSIIPIIIKWSIDQQTKITHGQMEKLIKNFPGK